MITKLISCSACEAMREMELVTSNENIKIRGKSVTYKAEYYRCLTCSTELEEPEQTDRNLDAAREVYARLYQAPSPEELVTLRTRYNASQKAFGTLLGFSESTMNTYEKGSSQPDPSNRLLLMLAKKPVIFKEMYNLNKDKIGLRQRKKIEASVGFREAENEIILSSPDVMAKIIH